MLSFNAAEKGLKTPVGFRIPVSSPIAKYRILCLMPVAFLSDSERERLTCFPEDISADDLHSFFILSEPDKQHIPKTTNPANRVGYALQLCALRYLGYCPGTLAHVPAAVLSYVAAQLDVPVNGLAGTVKLLSSGQRKARESSRAVIMPP